MGQSSGQRWAGFHVGASAGYAWGDSTASLLLTGDKAGFLANYGESLLADINGVAPASFAPSSLIGGVQLGYVFQSGYLAIGGEADFQWLDIKGDSSTTRPLTFSPAQTFTVSNSVRLDWLSTVRARFGIATPGAFFYATGGLALADVAASHSFLEVNAFGRAVATLSEIRKGWTAGGGVEAALDRNWSIRAEYLYVDLGESSSGPVRVTSTVVGTFNNIVTGREDYTLHILRGGINYKF